MISCNLVVVHCMITVAAIFPVALDSTLVPENSLTG
jgi:hypothetical protein